MPRKSPFIDINNLIFLYQKGFSVKQLAKHFNVSRSVIHRRLIFSNIIPRNRSESMYNRMKFTSKKQRQRLTEKAHIQRRIKGCSIEEQLNKAQTRFKTQSKIGKGEKLLSFWLSSFNLVPILQYPIHIYNVDIAIKPIVVELLINTCYPLIKERYITKTKYLLNHGWYVIWVWCQNINNLTIESADYIHSFYQSISLNPSSICEYRVIRGDGKFYSSGCFYD